ncbi:hypothetical protein [Alienimonas chondri]|nr:hypothetical protein [Alienimonas chondri]
MPAIAEPLIEPSVERRPTALDWLGHVAMLFGMTFVGALGCGLSALVVWCGALVWEQVRRAVAWSAADAWWMVPLWIAVAAFSFAVPVLSLIGIVKRLRRGPLRPAPTDACGDLRGSVLRRIRGLILGLMCLPLVGLCLWLGYTAAAAWSRGRFKLNEAAQEPWMWGLLAVLCLVILTSVVGLISAGRTVFQPNPPIGGEEE